MKLKAITNHKFFRPALGAALTILCGLCLLSMPAGEAWVNASYDYIFPFGGRRITNNLAVVLMDKKSAHVLKQDTNRFWNRGLHAQLLNKLAADKCALAVFDVHFVQEGNPETDAVFAAAIRAHKRVVLMQDVTDPKHPGSEIAQIIPPLGLFADAAAGCGVGKTDAQIGETVRRHWPFPAPGDFQSLPWVAAKIAGAKLPEASEEQWLRYYKRDGLESLSYDWALTNTAGYFSNKIVFIGNKPESSDPGILERDKFRTPYTRWSKESVGGVEILATTFLNLMNGDWLRRPHSWLEIIVLLSTGLALGVSLSQLRPVPSFLWAVAIAVVVSLGAICLSYFTNYWFPWLIITGGQVPCALAVSLVGARLQFEKSVQTKTVVITVPVEVEKPETPDYELFEVPFGEGAYGKVWLAKNAIGQWQALKTVYLARFATRIEPYDREFNGIRRYKPVSDKHPGLLRVDFVSTKKDAGYFYYVMELADAMDPGWETNPRSYRPRDLDRVRKESDQKRLPFQECARIGVSLTAALEFLHKQGLTHRDIKPRNILFARNQPKLGDVGLVADIRPADADLTLVGTPGYMPPAPEPPGTVQADIYGLGMVLYVILTGNEPEAFPEVGSVLVENIPRQDFIRLNSIILKACQPDRTKRYATVAEMHADLAALHQTYQRAGLTANI